MTAGELHFEALQACQCDVTDTTRLSGVSDCGEPASHRASWDGGKTWLYLCPEHARRVEEAEEEATP